MGAERMQAEVPRDRQIVHRDLPGLWQVAEPIIDRPERSSSLVRDPAHDARSHVGLGCLSHERSPHLEERMADNRNWDQEDKWWEQNFNSRPYAAGRTL